MSVSIIALEKSINSLVKKLQKEGLTVEMCVSKSPAGSYDNSYVELCIEDENGNYMQSTFYAGTTNPYHGYYGKISEMKSAFMNDLSIKFNK